MKGFVSKKHIGSQIIDKIRKRPGHISACGLVSSLFLFTYVQGPKLDSEILKYVLAGTTATVGVELGSHFIDTINMKSKVMSSSQSFYGKQKQTSLIKRIFSMENMKGYQMVVHGYFFSCIVFFSV